ncbi:MAG: hypothetical protein J0M25_00635 [Flavobacteriales bacterium]|nr:hypothetical protein [Flavobacteriales bacterium]
MKKSILFIVIAVLMYLLWMKSCTSEPSTEPQKIVVPEVKGESPITKPVQVVVVPGKPYPVPSKATPAELEFLQKHIDSLLKQNNDMTEAFAVATDSMQKEMYKLAISIRAFEECYGDEHIEINSSGYVRGEIQSMQFKYLIREKTIDAPPQKEVTFRLMGGVEFGNTLSFDSFLVKGNLGFQNKKGNIFTASFDTEQRIWVGYNASIFKIKN